MYLKIFSMYNEPDYSDNSIYKHEFMGNISCIKIFDNFDDLLNDQYRSIEKSFELVDLSNKLKAIRYEKFSKERKAKLLDKKAGELTVKELKKLLAIKELECPSVD